MSKAELVTYVHELEGQLRDDVRLRGLVHELQVRQEELETQQQQLIEAQQALETARDRYADLFDFAPVGYVMMDSAGTIEEINVVALRMIGARDRTATLRVPLVTFVAPDDRPAFRAHLRVLGGGAERAQTEVRLRGRGTGDRRIVQIHSRMWTRRDENTARYLTLLIDVSEQRRAEDARRSAEAERRSLAEEERAMRLANQAKDRFLAALSHELRTPLTPILLVLDAMMKRDDVPEAIEPTLRVVRRNVEQEARLIDDLLDVTRIAHDKLRCEHATLEVHKLMRDVHAGFLPEAAASGIELALALDAVETHVLGDAVRLKQVTTNLLRNALRHTPPGGRITVRSDSPGPGTIRITVMDTGTGIPPALLERIFVPFEQVDRVHGVGLGLGLAIARGLVEQHGGRIAAQSGGTGTGATFTVELPTVPPPTAGAGVDQVPAGRPNRDATVLLVEDHADSAEAIEMGLTMLGYRVITTGSVRSALAHAEREHFDIVVSDLGLPDGSGLDIMRTLMARRPVPGIALSGFGAAADVRASREVGFQRHLVKPVDLAQLGDAIEELLVAGGAARLSGARS